MKSGTSLLTAILCSAVGLVAYTTRGDSTEPSGASKMRESSCEVSGSGHSLPLNSLQDLPTGEYEYVRAEYRLALAPSAGSSESPVVRVDERVYREGPDLKIHSQVGCSSGLSAQETSVKWIVGTLPRIFNFQSEAMNVGYRSFGAGHEGGHSAFQIHDLPPALGIAPSSFLADLRSSWSTHHFEKLAEPYHYAIRVQQVTPSGLVEARVIYRNTEQASRAREVNREVARAAQQMVM